MAGERNRAKPSQMKKISSSKRWIFSSAHPPHNKTTPRLKQCCLNFLNQIFMQSQPWGSFNKLRPSIIWCIRWRQTSTQSYSDSALFTEREAKLFKWTYFHININIGYEARRGRESKQGWKEEDSSLQLSRKCGVYPPRGDETLSRKQSGKMVNKQFAVCHAAEELQPACF